MDESITENILKAIQTYASVSGQFDFTSTRDAFVSCACQAAVPASYLSALKAEGGPSHATTQQNVNSASSVTSLSSHPSSAATLNSGNGNREVICKAFL